MPNPEWSIIVHGGARDIPPEEHMPSRQVMLDALEAAKSILARGGEAIEAAEAAILILENCGIFNAGRGSVGRADGTVQMDASIMEGKQLKIGAVAGLHNTENPILVARSLLDETPILLTGHHADEYALSKGFETRRTRKGEPEHVHEAHDTVGCVIRDAKGNIVVGLSTGGLDGAMPGRVGDVPLPGCGFYADNTRAGLCFSGDGEKIARVMLAAETIHRLETMSPQQAVEDGLSCLDRVGGEAGCILIDRNGEIAWAHNSPHFAVAYQSGANGRAEVYLSQEELKK